jgi:hypothetical protein
MPERLRFEKELSDLGLSEFGTGKYNGGLSPNFEYRSSNNREFEKNDSSGQMKVGIEIDLAEHRTEKLTKYGKWTIFATLKTTSSVSGGSGLPVGGSLTVTSKTRDGVKEKGAKQDFSYSGFKNSLKNLKIENLSINLSGEWSGLEIAAFATAKFEFVSGIIGKIPASLKILLFRVKEGEKPKIGEVEGSFDTPSFDLGLPGVKTKVFIRYKIRWALDKKQVGKEILKKIAKDKLKKEVKKRGVIWLGSNVGKGIVKKLGPIITAFSVGWDIGTFLNENTVADEVALDVQKEILGDLNERYHRKGTLGKMFLIARNSPRIIAALVSSGIIGTMAGIGDLILFKIFGLDNLAKNFSELFERFRELKKLIPNVGEAFGDMIFSTVLKMGIKFNPKYSKISNPDIRIFASAIFKNLKPIYRQKGGLQKIIDLKIQDLFVDEKVDYHKRVVDFIVKNKLVYGSINGNAEKNEVFGQFLESSLQPFLQLLEKYKLISYKITISDELSTSAIGQELVDELFI